MRPTLNLDFRYGARDVSLALRSPMQGFDSLRIISQIVSLQCLHYLVLALLLPPLLATLSFNQSALSFQGGPTSLSLILDWREMAGVPILDGGRSWPWNSYKPVLDEKEMEYLKRAKLNTSMLDDMDGLNRWWEWDVFLQSDSLHWLIDHNNEVAWNGQRPGKGGVLDGADMSSLLDSQTQQQVDYGPVWWTMYARDSSRGWIIVLAWALTGMADVFLLMLLIRRPTHILDHTLTLHLFHLLLTSLYTRNIPTNLFYWLVMLAHTGACVVWAEALSIKREMRTGWVPGWQESEAEQGLGGGGENDEERSQLLASNGAPSMSQAASRPTTHVLFEDNEEDDDDDDDEELGRDSKGATRQESIEMKRMN